MSQLITVVEFEFHPSNRKMVDDLRMNRKKFESAVPQVPHVEADAKKKPPR
jgi:hypothetical protein